MVVLLVTQFILICEPYCCLDIYDKFYGGVASIRGCHDLSLWIILTLLLFWRAEI